MTCREKMHWFWRCGGREEDLNLRRKTTRHDLQISLQRLRPALAACLWIPCFVVSKRVKEPETRVIMLTGFGALAHDPEAQSEFVDLVLAKPATLAELRAAIAQVMA